MHALYCSYELPVPRVNLSLSLIDIAYPSRFLKLCYLLPY